MLEEELEEDDWVSCVSKDLSLVVKLKDEHYDVACPSRRMSGIAWTLECMLLRGTIRYIFEDILGLFVALLAYEDWQPSSREIAHVRSLLRCADDALGRQYIDERARPILGWPVRSQFDHEPFRVRPTDIPSRN